MTPPATCFLFGRNTSAPKLRFCTQIEYSAMRKCAKILVGFIFLIAMSQYILGIIWKVKSQMVVHNMSNLPLLLTKREKPKRFAIVTLAIGNTPGTTYSLDEVLPKRSPYRKWLQEKIDYCMNEENDCDLFIETTLDPMLNYPHGWITPKNNRGPLSNTIFYQKQKSVRKIMQHYGKAYEWILFVDNDTKLMNHSVKLEYFIGSTSASVVIVDRKEWQANAACFMIKTDDYGRKFLYRWISMELHPFFQEDNGAFGFVLGEEMAAYKNINIPYTANSTQYYDKMVYYWLNATFPGRYHPNILSLDHFSSTRPFCVRPTSKSEPTYLPGDFMVHRKATVIEYITSFLKNA
jgi:hypothetical protein